MDYIVSMEQSAFVKGRQIMDGPMILNEILNLCKKVGEKQMFLKLISRRRMIRFVRSFFER